MTTTQKPISSRTGYKHQGPGTSSVLGLTRVLQLLVEGGTIPRTIQGFSEVRGNTYRSRLQEQPCGRCLDEHRRSRMRHYPRLPQGVPSISRCTSSSQTAARPRPAGGLKVCARNLPPKPQPRAGLGLCSRHHRLGRRGLPGLWLSPLVGTCDPEKVDNRHPLIRLG